MSEKYISDDTLVMKSLYSCNDISFLAENTWEVKRFNSSYSAILSLYSISFPCSQLYIPSCFFCIFEAIVSKVISPPAFWKGTQDNTILTSSSEMNPSLLKSYLHQGNLALLRPIMKFTYIWNVSFILVSRSLMKIEMKLLMKAFSVMKPSL